MHWPTNCSAAENTPYPKSPSSVVSPATLPSTAYTAKTSAMHRLCQIKNKVNYYKAKAECHTNTLLSLSLTMIRP